MPFYFEHMVLDDFTEGEIMKEEKKNHSIMCGGVGMCVDISQWPFNNSYSITGIKNETAKRKWSSYTFGIHCVSRK